MGFFVNLVTMGDYLRKWFKKSSILTISNVYLLILAGGVVRCTGSGMGCPDWPKCFGKWIPPTTISELPLDYVDRYSNNGHLDVEFNVYKTWTEYINRLLGVFVGFSIFVTFIASLGFWKQNKTIVFYSFLSFIFVGIEGWIGAKVVASNLRPIIVSVHLLMALVIVILLIKAITSSELVRGIYDVSSKKIIILKRLSITLIVLVLIQILLGTQVRQFVDSQFLLGFSKVEIIGNLNFVFGLHVFMAYMVLFSSGFLVYSLFQNKVNHKVGICILGTTLVEYLGGLYIYKFSIPSYMQPIHLTCGCILFGLSFYLFVSLQSIEKHQATELVKE